MNWIQRALLPLLLASTLQANGQASFEWVRTIGNTNSDEFHATTTDPSGHVYTVGMFAGTIDLDPGPAQQLATSNGGNDIMVHKLDSLGNLIWAKTFGGFWSETPANAAVTDTAGNLILGGQFSDTVDFDPGPGTHQLIATAADDIFLLKLSPAGNLIWAYQIAGPQQKALHDIDLDTAGNIILTGAFAGTADFDPGPATYNLGSNSASDAFICKWTSTGAFSWAAQVGSATIDEGRSTAVLPDAAIITTGFFTGAADFDPGPATYTLTATNSEDAFLLKLDPAGTFQWAAQISGTLSQQGQSICIDHSQHIYIAGFFSGTADFDPGPATFSQTSAGNRDAFLARYTPAGAFSWVGTAGSTSIDQASAITYQPSGHILLTGTFYGTVDFDFSPASQHTLSATAFRDVFIARYDTFGAFAWAAPISGAAHEFAYSIATQGPHIYLAGSFSGTTDFDPDTTTHTLSPIGAYDSYLLKLTQCQPTNDSLYQFGCNHVTVNGITYTFNGNYTQTLTNAAGCDSLLFISVTLTPLQAIIFHTGSAMMATPNSATYQWLDCANMQPIPGATSQFYQPAQSGSYAVIVTRQNCTDTSDCETYVGLPSTPQPGITIHPNPTSGPIHITTPSAHVGSPYTLTDLHGRVLRAGTLEQESTQLDLSALASAIYILHMQGQVWRVCRE